MCSINNPILITLAPTERFEQMCDTKIVKYKIEINRILFVAQHIQNRSIKITGLYTHRM